MFNRKLGLHTVKKILKILWLTAVALTALFLAGILGIQTPQVQTYLAQKVLDNFADMADADIRFEKIHFKPFNTIVLKDVAIIDAAPVDTAAADTLFKSEYIIARFTLRGLRKQEGLHIWRAVIKNAEMNLVIEDEVTNLQRIFRIKKDPDRPRNRDKNIFDIRRVDIDGMRFRLQNFRKGPMDTPHDVINWGDLDIRNIRIAARNMKFSKGIMSGRVDELSFSEKSGYVCTSLSGETRVGNGQAVIEGLRIRDPWSDIDIPSFTMSYSCSKDFKKFIDKVRLDGEIADSHLDMATLGYFAAGLKGNGLTADISGKVSGTVSDFTIDGIEIDAGEDNVSGTFSGRISGLPETGRMFIDMNVGGLRFSTAGLENFIGCWSRGRTPDLGRYASGERFNVHGRLRGTLNRMDADMSVNSGSGSLMADMRIGNLLSDKESITLDGYLRTDDLDIGRMTGTGLVRQCTLEAGLDASLGNRDGDPSITLDSLIVSRLNANGYDYSNIAAKGTIAKEAFDGKIICNDPNLNFMFQGQFNLSRKTSNALYKFYMNVGYADLNAMNLDKRGISRIRFQTTANFNWITRRGDLLGDIDIADIVLENRSGKYEIGDIGITSYSGDNLTRMRFDSAFADGRFSGTGSLASFVRDLNAVTLKRELPAIFRDTTAAWSGSRYKMSFRTYDTMDLLAFLAPGLYVADSTLLSMSIDTSGVFETSIKSQRIAFREQYIKDIDCFIDNKGGSLEGRLDSGTIKFATLSLKNNRLDLFADNNHIGIGFSYDNESTLTNRGEFFATGDISRIGEDMMIDVALLPSSIYLNSREWSIAPSSFSIKGRDIDVGNISFNSGDQSIRIYGNTSEREESVLNIDLDRFDISVINSIMRKDLSIAGAVTGKASIFTPYDRFGMEMDFLCDSASISGTELGTVTLASGLDNNTRNLDFRLSNILDGRSAFMIEGNYGTSAKKIEADAVLDRFDMSWATPFVEKIISRVDGSVSGKFSLDGPLDRLAIKSDGARFDDTGIKVAFTNVPYRLNGGFHIDETGLYFDDIRVSDNGDGRGVVRGEITYDFFKNIRFNTGIDVFNMQCIDIAESPSATFYGNVKATGSVGFTGPVRSLLMTVNAATSGNGQFHVPLSSATNAGGGDLLTFKKPVVIEIIDPYEKMVERLKEEKTSSGDFRMRLQIAADQDIEAFIEVDKASGNVLSGRGEGVIDLEIQPSKDIFNITGDYTISSGNYRFVALGLASRDFSIQEGSSVRFNGDIMESTLDIDAVYNTKASLSTLIADTTSVANRRNVECGISITDKLSNPRLGFSINIPDLDPTVQSRVESALSTEDKVQKQFLSLIISNSFLPDEQSGVVNNASVLYSNVAEIMSNQLNNIFQKLDIPLDLGLSYQPNEKGNDIFDVAVSTQLFNNRVIVNGNIGNRQYNSGNSNSDVVGDLDIEIKLTRSGALRLNLFSHSADEYTNYLDNSQRNGVGITYQKEFDRIDTFFKNLFTSRKKREEAERQEFMERRRQKKNVIIIQPDKDDSK